MKRLLALTLVLVTLLTLLGCTSSQSADDKLFDRLVAPKAKKLTLEKVIELADEKGESLTWSDFKNYHCTPTGSGLLILVYDLRDSEYQLVIGGFGTDFTTIPPMYIRLMRENDRNHYIDIRTDDIDAFLAST